MSPNRELRERVLQMATAKLVTKPLYVAVLLNLPDHLAEAPSRPAELAERLRVHPDALYRLLRAVASVGLFSEDEEGRFSTAPLGELVRDRPGSLRPLVLWMNDPRHDRLWSELLHCVQTGEPAALHAVGHDFWEYLDAHPDWRDAFGACMTANARMMHAAAMQNYDFIDQGKVVDVGGCRGALLQLVLQSRPGLRGVLFDRPQVVDEARRDLEAKQLIDRCEVVGGDFFDSVPGGDLHVLSHILHDWSDEHAIRILRNCFRAGRPGGRVAIIEMPVPPDGAPSFAKLIDLEMLVLPGGRERTAAEYQDLLSAAGYRPTRVLQGKGVAAVIEGMIDVNEASRPLASTAREPARARVA